MISARPAPPIDSDQIVHAGPTRGAALHRAVLPNLGRFFHIVNNRSRLLPAVVIVAIALQAMILQSATAQTTTTAAQELAEQYAPIAELRRQSRPCDRKGEAYFPSPVETVLGNPDVALKQATGRDSRSDTLIKMAPTAEDLAGKDGSFYLDFPGQPNHPGCQYEQAFKRYAAQTNATPTTYAHIVVDRERGKLVLQYWFWYYFNDWNNTHESDWEMIQIVFAATSPEAALATEPEMVGFAQHAGGELADWNDPKLERSGTHPIIRPSAGSHGTYFGRDIYVGWGEGGTGFGCDNTSTPVRRVPLTPVLLPDTPEATGSLAWLSFEGHWGERRSWEFNGPTGPNAKYRWTEPIDDMENWRDSSLDLPSSNAIGPNATDLFCSITQNASQLVVTFGNNVPVLIGVFAAILVAIVGLFVVKREEIGEALAFYRGDVSTFFGIGLVSIPIGFLYSLFAYLIKEHPPGDWVIKWFNDTAGASLTTSLLVGGVQQISVMLIIAPPVLQAIRDRRDGQPTSVVRSFRLGYRRFRIFALTLGAVVAILAGASVLIFSVPMAIWLAVRWQFFSQAIVLNDSATTRAALSTSARTVKGRWWHSLGDSLVFQVFSLLPGPVIGAILLPLGAATVTFANAFSSFVFAITVPIAVIGLTLSYLRYATIAERSS